MTTLDHQVDRLVAAWRRLHESDARLAEMELEAVESAARSAERRAAVVGKAGGQ